VTRTDLDPRTRAELDARTDLALTGAVAALFRGKAAELRALAETLTPADHTRAIALAIRVARLATRVQTVAEQVAGFNAMAPARAGNTRKGRRLARQAAKVARAQKRAEAAEASL